MICSTVSSCAASKVEPWVWMEEGNPASWPHIPDFSLATGIWEEDEKCWGLVLGIIALSPGSCGKWEPSAWVHQSEVNCYITALV